MKLYIAKLLMFNFISMLHCADAVQDSNYPERAYLPPNSPGGPELVEDPADVPGKAYSHQYCFPAGLIGSHVLIQWHYVTSECAGCASYDMTFHFFLCSL